MGRSRRQADTRNLFRNFREGYFTAPKATHLLDVRQLHNPTLMEYSLPDDKASVRDIASRLELFVDDFLIESLRSARLQLHHPHRADVALHFDAPWEGIFAGAVTAFQDGPIYRMYYRGKPNVGGDGSDDEVICYAESSDGVHWKKPQLGFFEVLGTRQNNVILTPDVTTCHYFSPFLDTRPGVPDQERYKAITGVHPGGLKALASADGIRWRMLQDAPILISETFAFDSQNIAFWSENEGHYVMYFRTWKAIPGEAGMGYRWVSRTTSDDFLHWSTPVEMDMGDTPLEHIYTNQTHPYFRAPHLYISLAARFQQGKQVLTREEAQALGVSEQYYGDCSDTILMTSRGGSRYDRTFMESFVRPGIGSQNWVSRTNYPGCGVIPTGPNEMSLFVSREYAQQSAHIARYTLRTDGFASINAPYGGGEFLTRPLTFTGKTLSLNCSTSAAGSIQVEIQDAHGKALPGFELNQCIPIVGDEIAKRVQWKSTPDLRKRAGQAVRLRFVMRDADLYALQFLAS